MLGSGPRLALLTRNRARTPKELVAMPESASGVPTGKE